MPQVFNNEKGMAGLAAAVTLYGTDGNPILAEGVNIKQQADVTADDSDKTFTVPAGKFWIVKWIYVAYVSNPTAGNRTVRVDFKDPTNIFAYVAAGATQAANLTRSYFFGPGVVDDTSFGSQGELFTDLGVNFPLPPGYTVRVYDSAAIAPAADDMTVRMIVDERSAGSVV